MADRQELIRQQSAELAAMLAAGEPQPQGGIRPRPPTPKERRLLDALADGKPRRPDELIEANPETFADASVAGLHMTAASLVRKGWATRHKRTLDKTYRRAYKITPEGRGARQP